MRAALLAVLLLSACDEAPLPKVDRPLLLLARPTVAGDMLETGGFAGRVVVVNFWSPG